jgi:glycerate 2-kinase
MDGPTDVAGGVADGCTVDRARRLEQNVHDVLRRHDSGSLLERLGDTIVTGNTDTNVCDLNLIYVAAPA